MSGSASGQGAPSEKVIVYNFQDASDSTDYRYYSYIIADSIAVELKKKEQFDVQTFPAIVDYIDAGDTSSEKAKNHIVYLSERGREFNASFIISGQYIVDKKQKRITIKSQIFNVHDQKIIRIDERSDQLGALLFLVIDNITTKINRQLDTLYEERKELAEKSPYISLYNAMRGISFGVNVARVKFFGDWGSIYDEGTGYSTFLKCDMNSFGSLGRIAVVRNSSIVLGLDVVDVNDNHQSYFSSQSLSLGYSYALPFTSFSWIAITAGGGVSRSEMILSDPLAQSGDPFSSHLAQEISYDPCMSVSLSARFMIRPLTIEGGVFCRRVFYSDTPMDMGALFFGIGYAL